MSLFVQIEKSFPGGFHLAVEFAAEDEILGLLGPSGCGKSMTLRCIAGIEKPDSGKIVLNGVTLYDSTANICLTPQKRRTGYMFQNYALFPNFTVAENIAAGLQEKTKEEKARLVKEQLESLHLNGLADRYPKQLSGGQQQRVALARILASSPDILMLDEPFSALDSHLRYQLEESFQDTLSHYPGTVLYVSHSNEEIYRYCNRVALLSDGHLEGIMTKETLFQEPQTLAGAQLTACRNISPIQQRSDGLYAELWQIPLPAQIRNYQQPFAMLVYEKKPLPYLNKRNQALYQ